MFPTLVSLLALMEAYLLEQATPAVPVGGAVGGLSDEDLWTRLAAANGDVLDGMSFQAAVVQDPRRVVALIEQRVIAGFYRPLTYTSGRSEGAMRHSWLSGYAALRQDRGGAITVQGIRDLWLLTRAQETVDRGGQPEVQPPNYLRLLDAAVPMARPNTPARSFWEHVQAEQVPLRRMFSEATEIAERAALCAADEGDADAWRQIGATLTDVRDGLEDRLARFVVNPPQTRAPRERAGGFGGLADDDDSHVGVGGIGVFGGLAEDEDGHVGVASYGRSDNANARTKRNIQAQHKANARAYAAAH